MSYQLTVTVFKLKTFHSHNCEETLRFQAVSDLVKKNKSVKNRIY